MRFALLVLAACGTPKPARVEPEPPKPKLAACPTAASFELPDGKLRCRELPFDIEFPAGAKVERADNKVVARFSTAIDGGALALVVMPRMVVPNEPLADIIGGIAKGMLEATTSPLQATAVAGTDDAVAFSITTETGTGEIRGYVVGRWVVALIAGGTGEAATRPDRPAGTKFFTSFAPRMIDGDALVRFELPDHAHLDIPAAAWPKPQPPPTAETLGMWAFFLPATNGFLGIREITPEPACARLAAARDDNIESEIRLIFSDQPMDLKRAARGTLGRASAAIDVTQDGLNEAAYLVCDGKSLVQLSVFGTQPHAELRVVLDRVAKTYVGSR